MTDHKKQMKALNRLLKMQRRHEKQIEQMTKLFPDEKVFKTSGPGTLMLFQYGALWLSIMDMRTCLEDLITTVKYPKGSK